MTKVRAAFVCLSAAPFAAGIALTASNKGAQPKVDYAKEVAPILKAHCLPCHGPDSPSASLSFNSLASTMKGGVSGRVIVPGNSKDSLLVHRLLGQDGKPSMPMGFAALPEAQIATIRAWIDQGASSGAAGSGKHWAYVAPVVPSIPGVKNKAWVRNPIDAFVLARLEKEGLKPSPEASKETLIRRAALDLTGLPPTPDEVAAFVSDKSPDAYERLVDRLLASPQYGERQARFWLDMARYADTDGYEKDLRRTAWKYRDWVIDAFNRNLPYDRFTIDQLAGDLLPNPTLDEKVATGFHRNTMHNLEGGVDQREALFEVVLDRVGTTGTVWLGTTLACARCHDHKYDPFTQKDFYKMYAFYGSPQTVSVGNAVVGEEKWYEAEIPVPTKEQEARQRTLKSEIVELDRRLHEQSRASKAARSEWEKLCFEPTKWTALKPESAKSVEGADLAIRPDLSVLASGKNPDKDSFTVVIETKPGKLSALRLEALTDPSLPNKGPGRSDNNGNFGLSKFEVRKNGKPLKIDIAAADLEQEGFPVRDAIDANADTAWAIFPQRGKPHEAVFQLAQPVEIAQGDKIEIELECRTGYTRHVIGCFRISGTSDDAAAARMVPESVRTLIRATSRTSQQEKSLGDYYLSVAPMFAPLRERLAKSRMELNKLEADIPTAMVMRDKRTSGPLTAAVHKRGEFLNPTEIVDAGTPAVLPPLPKALPANRLGLANWIVSRENPLTARVAVNRFWEQYFGIGIVETSEDFGTQGATPSHPELLDWLACKFMDLGWDMKAVHRLIVTSATYRQASNVPDDLLKRDPKNQLLARGPRFRLDAEAIRDSALFQAGLLSLKLGGPSVFPSQPEGIWNLPYNGDRWMASPGAERYRRGIYTFWRRTSPYPEFLAFDATSREQCTVRRIRTNTPLQALTTLNDTVFVEASKGLAKRMAEASGPLELKLAFGFRVCTARKPSQEESSRLASLYAKQLERYKGDEKASKSLGDTPELAALAVVANVLLNLDETLTKG